MGLQTLPTRCDVTGVVQAGPVSQSTGEAVCTARCSAKHWHPLGARVSGGRLVHGASSSCRDIWLAERGFNTPFARYNAGFVHLLTYVMHLS